MDTYYTPMDRAYMAQPDVGPSANVEKPLIPISEVGQTVTEGSRFGTLIQTTQGAIRMGAGSIELQTGFGGGAEAVGAEAYGKDSREALREMAKANQVTLTSVHTPTQVGNLSGLGQQGFSEEQRKSFVDEVKKAIKFAAETTQGGAVVIHTGEYQRPIFSADWNTKGKWKDAFIGYEEEPEMATEYLVDQRTGKLVSEIRRNQIIHRPIWNKSISDYEYAADDYDVERGMAKSVGEMITVSKDDYVDYEGKKLEPEDRVAKWNEKTKQFDVKAYTWQNFEEEAKEMNQRYYNKTGKRGQITPEEAAMKAQIQGQIAIAKGWKLNYGRNLDGQMEALGEMRKQLEFYQKIEAELSDDDLYKWRKEAQSVTASLLGRVGMPGPPGEYKMPSELIKEAMKDLRQGIEQSREMVLGQEQSIKQSTQDINNIVSVNKYAKSKSMKSYVDAALYAMNETENNPYAKRDIFVAPENIFPEMGYGSHPEELKELVIDARKAMAKRLVNPYTEDPTGKRIKDKDEAKRLSEEWGKDLSPGDPVLIANPNYMGISKEKAKEISERFIKATLDTQHLGMWWKHFAPKKGEKEKDRRERFSEWYMDEIKSLQKNNIIGNIHLVDSVGGGHHHLPMGQGDLPLTDALTYLKKRGFTGSINSEAHGESQMGADRILVETWKQLGSPIYSHGSFGASVAGARQWGDIHRSYFGQQFPPYFIFGAYAPSQEFSLWSEVPME